MNKKKILIVTRNLPPLIGGMERLNWHIADELSKDHQVLLLSHKKAKTITPKQTEFYGVPLNPLPLFLIWAFLKTFLICLIQKPDVLFAGSGLTAPIVVFWAKIFSKKSIVYIHGLDINNHSQIYQMIWIPFIQNAHQIICNSSPTQQLVLDKNISSSKVTIIHPGVNYPAPPEDVLHIAHLKDKYQLQHKKVLLSVGRLTDRKGLLEFVNKCLPQIIQTIPNIVLVIVGDTANNALNNKFQKKQDIIEVAKKYHIDKHIIFTGSIEEKDLNSFYDLADVHVFPVKNLPGDPEGFGMVAIEAATHGTPTIAFATGGIVDAVKERESGFLIEIANYKELSNKIIEYYASQSIEITHSCRNFASNFSWLNVRKKLNDEIKKL